MGDANLTAALTVAALLEAYRTDNHNISLLHQLLYAATVYNDAALVGRVLRYAYEPYRHRGRVLGKSLATHTNAKRPDPLAISCERPREPFDQSHLRYYSSARSPPSALVLESLPPRSTGLVEEGRTFSSVKCGGRTGGSSACLFERVCIGPQRRMQFYSHSHQGCEMEVHRERRYIKDWMYIAWHGYATNFSESHHVDCRAHALPLDASMVPGRTLLWEVPPGLTAHDSQFSLKLRRDRSEEFPSDIHHILWSPHMSITAHNIDMLRASFGDVGFNIPPIYAPADAQLYAEPTCFEELLVPRNEHFAYRSTEEAESFSAALSTMCALDTEASMADRPSRPRILFLERAFDRQIINAPSMCTWVSHAFAAEAQLISDSLTEQQGLCAAVEIIRRHEIFVTIGGSQALLLSFARPGSVVILVDPKNSFDGLSKLQLSMARMHVLEFLVHRPTELVPDNGSFEYHARRRGRHRDTLVSLTGPGSGNATLNAGSLRDFPRYAQPLRCAQQAECYEFWRRHHVWLNLDEFVAFLEHARNVSSRASRASVRADDSEPDPQFTEWGIQLAPSDEGDHTSQLPRCQQRPAEPEGGEHITPEYEFVRHYGRFFRRVAWEVSLPALRLQVLRLGCYRRTLLNLRAF
jgi:hypothetical protein